MPPQVGRTDGAGSAVPQLPPPEAQKDDSKSTSSTGTSESRASNAANTQGTPTKTEVEDPKIAAKAAQQSK